MRSFEDNSLCFIFFCDVVQNVVSWWISVQTSLVITTG